MSFPLLQLTPVGPVSPKLPSVRAWKVQVSKAYVNGPRSRVMSDLIRQRSLVILLPIPQGPYRLAVTRSTSTSKKGTPLTSVSTGGFFSSTSGSSCAFLVTGGLLAKLENSLTTPLYRSSATIQIDPHSNVPPYEEIQAITEGLQGGITQRKILESRLLARRVVDRLDLAHDPPFDGFDQDRSCPQASRSLRICETSGYGCCSPFGTSLSPRLPWRRKMRTAGP